MKKGYFLFTKKLHYRSSAMNYVQCDVINVITKDRLWLGFSKSSPMFARVCNIPRKGSKRCGEFKAYVSYNEHSKDRVKKIQGEELDAFSSQYAEYFI